MEFKSAQCPTCGGLLQLPDDRRSVNCMYCGATVLVREAIQAAAAASVPNLLKLAHAAAQSSNYVEAYEYFNRVLEIDAANSNAWAGKAEAAGRMSGQQSFRMPEMINYFRNAVEAAHESEVATLKVTAANTLCRIITDDYSKMRAALSSKFWEPSGWTFYLTRVRTLIDLLEEASKFIPSSRPILQTMIWFCDCNYQEFYYQNNFNGHRSRRYFDAEWNSWINTKKDLYAEALYTLDPSLRPTPSDNSVVSRVQTSRGVVMWIVAAAFLLGAAFLVTVALATQ